MLRSSVVEITSWLKDKKNVNSFKSALSLTMDCLERVVIEVILVI